MHRCVCCGAPLEEVGEEQKLIKCQYCGKANMRPKHSKDGRYHVAQRLREEAEFEQALAEYEKLLNEDDEDYTAHWGALLCKYGIEYVEDPSTGEILPTCHLDRVSDTPLQKEAHYLKTVEYAPAEVADEYEKEVKQIDAVRADILATMKTEEPYDVFICYKSKDQWGHRTEDSVWAQDIYDELLKKEYRVFFADKTIELGMKYEPVIFHALYSAKIMVVVGTRREYLESRWVKNEWSRFLKLMQKSDRSIFPVYKDMPAEELPDVLKPRQAKNLADVGAVQDLVSIIDKILRNQKPVQITKPKEVYSTGGQNERLLKNGETFRMLGDYAAAESVYKTVTTDYPEDYRGWWGLILCKTKEFQELPKVNNIERIDYIVEPKLDVWYRHVRKLAPEKEFSELEKEYLDYAERSNAEIFTPVYIEALKREIALIKERIKSGEREIGEVRGRISKCEEAKKIQDADSDSEINKYEQDIQMLEKKIRQRENAAVWLKVLGIMFAAMAVGAFVFHIGIGIVFLVFVIGPCVLVFHESGVEKKNANNYRERQKYNGYQIGEWNKKKLRDEAVKNQTVRKYEDDIKYIENKKMCLNADIMEIQNELDKGKEYLARKRWELLRVKIQNS